MDPLTALGLASNIIQLISFTSDLVSKSREIYKSADGALVEHLELETIAKSLKDLSTDLPDELKRQKSLTNLEKQLRDLCEKCNEVSIELIEATNRLRATGHNKKWNSFRQALNSVWNDDKINALSKRLENYRSQLDTALLVSLREQTQADGRRSSKPWEKIREKELREKLWHAELIDALQQNNWQSKSQQDIAAFSLKLSEYTKEERERWVKRHILEQLRFTNMGDRYERIEGAYAKTFNWIFQEEGSVVYGPEIGGLAGEGNVAYGPEIEALAGEGSVVYGPEVEDLTRENEDSIMRRDSASPSAKEQSNKAAASETNASADVNEETRNPGWSSFINWLSSEEGVYWITGKPGSGKSTLMKYLYQDRRTLEHLRSWSSSFPLVMAGFFFWNSGTVMQMSKMGLLQALLYECINGSFELVPVLFPERWKSYELFGGDLRPWTWSELALAFETVLSDESQRFFFFIDGLDEFDGDCDEVVNFALKHSARSNVKICIASRPWLVFEDAFQRLPSLRLEDLTASDIHRVVSEKLRESNMFINLERLQPQEAKNLIAEVTGKASGVFLWVRLVVVSLLEGLRDGDSITDLQDRLRLLPLGLEDLFTRILNTLNPSYFEQASKLFQLVRESVEPLSLLSLAFAEDGFDKAMAAEVEPIPLPEKEYRAERMRRRLNSRCKGLLEAPISRDMSIFETQVQYLHRTVKDFLERPDIWKYVLSGLPPPFNPDISLFGAILLEIKTLSMSLETKPVFLVLLGRCIRRALIFESREPELHIRSLEGLDRAATKLFGSSYPSGGTWLEAFIRSPTSRQYKTSLKHTSPEYTSPVHWTMLLTGGAKSFFEYAVQFPLYSFIDHELKLGRSANSLVAGRFWLYDAVQSVDLRLIKILLNRGADPNISGDDRKALTPWKHALCLIQRGQKPWSGGTNIVTRPDDEAKLISIFLDHNADPWIIVNKQSVEDSINMAFLDWNQERTDELLRKVAVLKKTFKEPQKPPSRMKAFFKKLGGPGPKAT
jgi:hypothetical protein